MDGRTVTYIMITYSAGALVKHTVFFYMWQVIGLVMKISKNENFDILKLDSCHQWSTRPDPQSRL